MRAFHLNTSNSRVSLYSLQVGNPHQGKFLASQKKGKEHEFHRNSRNAEELQILRDKLLGAQFFPQTYNKSTGILYIFLNHIAVYEHQYSLMQTHMIFNPKARSTSKEKQADATPEGCQTNDARFHPTFQCINI